MPDLQAYYEECHGVSPCTLSVSIRGAADGSRTYFIGDPDGSGIPITDFGQVRNAIDEILGRVDVHPDGVSLRRVPPKADPSMPNLYAEKVGPIQGLGRPTMVPADPFALLDVPTFDYMAIYPCYKVPVLFTPRPYAPIQDYEMPGLADIDYYPPSGGAGIPYRYADEWLRYTDVERTPGGEWITCQAGQFKLDVASGKKPDDWPAGTGQLRLFLPKEGIKVTWYQVPEVPYIDCPTTSFIEMGLGCINQEAISFGNHSYPAGTLLFYAVGVSRYQRPIPKLESWSGNTVMFSHRKICDISFLFMFMDPPLGKDGDGNPGTPRAPVNQNVIQRGHNYVPSAHRNGWYFAKTVTVPGFADASGRGIFPSFPFQLLFSQPQ